MSSVPKHDNGGAGHVELHDSIAHRHAFQRRRRLGDDDGIEFGDLFVGVMLRRGDDVARRRDRVLIDRIAVRRPGLMIPQPALVSAQTLFDTLRGLIGAGIGIAGGGLRLKNDAGIEMDHAFRAEAESIFADRYMA